MKTRRLSIFSVCILFATVAGTIAFRTFSVFGSMAGHTIPAKTLPPAWVRSLHPNYPYSVIAGGAYNPSELSSARKVDQVVQEHYLDFDMKTVRMEQLTADRFQYVSYRRKEKIFWTKKKLRIPKGELLLTDGRNFARARCGNRLSENPHSQISPDEPSAALLTMPPVEENQLSQLGLAPAPPIGELPPATRQTLMPVLTTGAIPGTLPVDMPPIEPVSPIYPVPTGGFFLPPSAPKTPIQPPTVNPVIPPSNTPPTVTPVPEPSSVYLFVITFVVSLYGLTRLAREDGFEKEQREE